MSDSNIPRIGYRPNIYARPQTKNSATQAPRPPVPSSRNRMLKPGFETSSTPYSLPPAPKSQEKSPEPLPRKLEPYPVLSNFLFTEEQLKNTPSRKLHNISYEEEMTLRRAGTFFIKELCRRLNAPYALKSAKISARAMCVSMIYFHRFYMFHSLTTFDPLHLGTACLFLAAKCEECPRKLSHFSKNLYSLLHPDDPNPLENDELEPMNELITVLETAVLRTCAFELNIELPHVDIIQAPFPSPLDRLRKMAYHLTTDLLTTSTLCIQYESKTLAAACFFVAACYLDIDMEKDYGEKWFLLLDKNLTEDVLVKISKSLTSCLQDCKFIIKAERLPRPGESSHRLSEPQPQVPLENQIHDASKGIPPHTRENQSHEPVALPEHRPPSSSEGRSRERASQKEHRLSELSTKERPRAPYDQSRDRGTDVLNKDRPRAPYERQIPVSSQPDCSTMPHELRTPEAPILPYRQKIRHTPEMVQQERHKKSSRTPEAPAYESHKSSRERLTPEMPSQERPKKSSKTPEAPAYENDKPSYERRTPEMSPQEILKKSSRTPEGPAFESDRSSRGRRTPELPIPRHLKPPEISHQEQFVQEQSHDYGSNKSFEKISVDSLNDRHKPYSAKPKHERARENQPYERRIQNLEAPLLVPPPLPPPSSELRNKRKILFDEEVPQKRSIGQSIQSTKQRNEQVDFSFPPPPLPPPHDRRPSLPIREHGESSTRKNTNYSKVPTNSTAPQQQQISHADYRRDETRHSSYHRSEHYQANTTNQSSGSAKDIPLQNSPQRQRDVRKPDMMQNFVPAQDHSSKSSNHRSRKSPTYDDLEEGEIE